MLYVFELKSIQNFIFEQPSFVTKRQPIFKPSVFQRVNDSGNDVCAREAHSSFKFYFFNDVGDQGFILKKHFKILPGLPGSGKKVVKKKFFASGENVPVNR